MRHATTILLAAACLTLAGCSDSEPSQSVTKATPSPSKTASPKPTPKSETFKLGDTANLTAGGRKWTAAALTFKDSGISSAPGLLTDGQKWALVEIRVCNADGMAAFSAGPFTWTLAYADGARVDATSVSGGVSPGPLYPEETKLKGGDCVRGNLTFEVPKDGRAERVVYSPKDLDEPLEWQIGG